MQKTAKDILKKYGRYNPDLGDEYGKTLLQAMEEYAQQFCASAPQAVGPVWVKATNNPPLEKVLYLRDIRMGWKYTGRFVKTENLGVIVRLHSESGRTPNIADIEWLDESVAQQVFTREQVITIAKFAMVGVKDGDLKNFNDLMKYMDTNYPLTP